MTRAMLADPLPIDAFLPHISSEVTRARAAVVVAAPGAGKTTRVPPALLHAGPVVVLQPRRVAARAIVRRIAAERGWQVGREVGWHVRFDPRFGTDTRLLIVTEGMLTARMQSDPLLSDFATVVIDEFHERSVHADVALALARQAWLARADLRIVIMSATIDPGPVSRYLRGCPVVEVPGRAHPIEIDYAPGMPLPEAVGRMARRSGGDVLCFLPGAPEIERAGRQVRAGMGEAFDVLPLHGSLPSDDQDRVFSACSRRRIVLATNIAETSITVPRITAVVDTGLHKVARYDASRAVDSLEVERITADSAEQRAGRAGRLAPGTALRLWDRRDRLRPHREPEIARVDLSAPLLDVIAWGGDPFAFEWFDLPAADAMHAALELLRRLHAIEDGRLTPTGRQLQQLPLHPRLGRLLLEARGAWEASVACAVIAERSFVPERAATTSCDLLGAVDRFEDQPAHVQHVARQIHGLARRGAREPRGRLSEAELRRAILAGYPDRVAQRRSAGSPRLLLSSGTGALLTQESGVTSGDFLVALDVQAGTGARARDAAAESRVRLASLVDREWLKPTGVSIEHRLDPDSGTVRAVRVERYEALVMSEGPAPVDPDVAATLLAEAYIARGPRAADEQLLRRLAFAGEPMPFADLVRVAATRVRRVDDISLRDALRPALVRSVERLAPERLVVPSGRSVPLEYREDGSVSASVKLQELFGLAETPRIGARREPVLLLLLAPNGRPVQTTRDLRSFWERTYPEVRKELRGRYPRHPWPEDPWTAAPTARTRERRARRS